MPMLPFKPPEFRVIAVLMLLALAGSILVVIQRYEKAARFNFSLPVADGGYNYRYGSAKIEGVASGADSAARARLADWSAVSDDEKIDINTCGYYDFEALPGIGPALAERMVAHRDSIGRFKNVDELTNVKGIGPAKLALIRGLVEVK